MDKKNKKKFLKVIGIIAIMLLLIFLPLILDILIFSNNYVSKVSNDGWAGFLGGYIGGIIGGIVTLIAMIVPLKQTQEQITKAEKKSQLEEKEKFANEIAAFVIQYIGDLQIYNDMKCALDDSDSKLFREWKKYDDLYFIWKNCRGDRYFNGFKTYYHELLRKNISTQYPERFVRQQDFQFGEECVYDEYEKELESKMEELESARHKIKEQIDKARQTYVIGNNTYLLLELKLKNLPSGEKLWEALSGIQKEELVQIKLYPILSENEKFDEKLDEKLELIKDELKNFIDEYLLKEDKIC